MAARFHDMVESLCSGGGHVVVEVEVGVVVVSPAFATTARAVARVRRRRSILICYFFNKIEVP